MFSYFGSKSKIIKFYPIPKYNLIIEPYAGSARYSLYYSDKEIILNDYNKIISDIWEYLINATEKQIKDLPELEIWDDLRDFNLTEIERNLMGFMVNMGVTSPRHIYTMRAWENTEIQRCKRRILRYLNNIKHWKILNLDYKQLKNLEATWFIDPPYSSIGRYCCPELDYSKLAEWCKSRKGQIIVCENEKAQWLDFRFLCDFQSHYNRKIECVWTNN